MMHQSWTSSDPILRLNQRYSHTYHLPADLRDLGVERLRPRRGRRGRRRGVLEAAEARSLCVRGMDDRG